MINSLEIDKNAFQSAGLRIYSAPLSKIVFFDIYILITRLGSLHIHPTPNASSISPAVQ